MDHVSAARPELIRAMNEEILLGHIRRAGPCSRADLARMSGLSKPTVSLALRNIQDAGLVRPAGTRTGAPGRAALLYEIRGDAAFVLGLDAGQSHLRGALADLSGNVRAELADHRPTRPGEPGQAIIQFAEALCGQQQLSLRDVTQTVIGAPAAPGPWEQAASHPGGLPGWGMPTVRSELRAAFGSSLMLEADVGAAALAESVTEHGRGVESLAFLSVGTHIRIALVLGGQLRRGRHGTSGHASLPSVLDGYDEAGASGAVSAQRAAQAVCTVVAVVDPQMIVLGGPVSQAPGFADLVRARLLGLLPVQPEVRVSALGADAVVAGCVSSGIEAAWQRLTAGIRFGEPRQSH